jgi:hypothetical protein
MKPTLTPTEYEALSPDEKGRYVAIYARDQFGDDMLDKYRLSLPLLQKMTSPQTFKVIKDNFEVQVKESVELDGITLNVKDIKIAAKDFLFKLDGSYDDTDDAFVGGAEFGANWQKQQEQAWLKDRVVEILKSEITQKYSMLYDEGINKAIKKLISKIKEL